MSCQVNVCNKLSYYLLLRCINNNLASEMTLIIQERAKGTSVLGLRKKLKKKNYFVISFKFTLKTVDLKLLYYKIAGHKNNYLQNATHKLIYL